eukprot:TRINITY_DN70858_c0_g1_i1.p1 TRINITY_DN70858_c0_g1~~TRINITY_DN70858_c0_g1_i1.p1  ORF type:complete len:249 (-),score=33.75 TRINITY_DN70858_c0_g1_i1:171-893(-)
MASQTYADESNTTLRIGDNCASAVVAELAGSVSVADGTKVVYLIRHGESQANKRFQANAECCGLAAGRVPKMVDCIEGLRFWTCCKGDTPLTHRGRAQAKEVAARMSVDEFLVRGGVQLILHSGLQRARDTCRELFGACDVATEEDCKLNEISCKDFGFCPRNYGFQSFKRRVDSFRQALASRPEKVIVLVGHGMHFARLQGSQTEGLPQIMRNVEVRKCVFHVKTETVSDVKPVYEPTV